MVLVRDAWCNFLREVKFEGRSCRLQFEIPRKRDIVIVFLHGGHGDDLLESLSDSACLLHGLPNTAHKIRTGDFNVDTLPISPQHPFH